VPALGEHTGSPLHLGIHWQTPLQCDSLMVHDGHPLISVIVVSFSNAEYLAETIESVYAHQTYQPLELILVDNASHDNTSKIARRYVDRGLILIENKENRGFSGGNNDGIRRSQGEIILLLNPDAVLQPGALEAIAEGFARDDRVGVIGCKIYDMDGETLQHCGGWVDDHGQCDHYGRGEKDLGQYDEPREVEYVTGAAFAMRRSLAEELGGLDEDYRPAYFEETDFCKRTIKRGHKVLYLPTAKVLHHEAVSLTANSERFLNLFNRNRLRYVMKNTNPLRLFFRFLPREFLWAISEKSKGARRPLLRAYLAAVPFYLRLVGRALIGRLRKNYLRP